MSDASAAQSIGRYSLVDNPVAGRKDFNAFRDPFFYRAVAQLFISGFITTLILGRFFPNHQDTFKQVTVAGSFTASTYFLILVLGGMWSAGDLNMRRAVPLLVNLAIYQSYNTYLSFQYNEYYFNFIIALPAIFWLVHTEPELMEKYGFRKGHIIQDVLTGLAVAASISAFIIFVFFAYGFKFQYHPSMMIHNFSTGIPIDMAIILFIYMVWNRLRSRGMPPATGIAVMWFLFASLELPIFVNPATFERLGYQMPMLGLVFSSLMFCLLYVVTFKKFKNVFPGTLVLGATQMILHLAGII